MSTPELEKTLSIAGLTGSEGTDLEFQPANRDSLKSDLEATVNVLVDSVAALPAMSVALATIVWLPAPNAVVGT